MSAKQQNNREAMLMEYMTYGGLPQTVTMETSAQKEDYLKGLFIHTYLKDIKERYKIKHDDDLEELIDVMASSIGGLTNPLNGIIFSLPWHYLRKKRWNRNLILYCISPTVFRKL